MYTKFFAYARERYSILLERRTGRPRPWTKDPILDNYRFCNVFREDDRTTIWLREHVREKLPQEQLLLATIVFRWFNRIPTGEAIFNQNLMYHTVIATAWEVFWENQNTDVLKNAIKTFCGKGPYVTGAYCIIGMPNMPKIDGILACINNVCTMNYGFNIGDHDFIEDKLTVGWREVTQHLIDNPGTVPQEAVWNWFRRFPRSGDFMAYEIVTDLCYTPLLANAPDIMTWANPGPGALRGLNRIHGRELEQRATKTYLNGEMQDILAHVGNHWPSDWPRWDMRTVEHTLCEFDKYERLRLGEGRVKGVYR